MSDQSVGVVGRSILGRKENFQRKEVLIPEWGGIVLLRQLSSKEVSAIQALATDAVDMGKGQIKDRGKLSRFNFAMIAASWITADGELVLSDADFAILVDEPHSVINTLVTEIADFNKLDASSQADAKKNSGATRNGASGSS